MKLKVNALIFDFDGVIIDSGADIANAVCYTLKAFGRPELSKDEIISYVGRGAEELIRSCFTGCEEDIVKQALPFYKKYYLDNCILETRLYDNVKETLEFFRYKKMAVVTNKPEDLTYRILEGFGIGKYFKKVIGPESVKKLKPDPEGVLKVLDSFEEIPENAIMIGDTYTDIVVGKEAGVHTCGVTYGLGDTKALLQAGPDFIIDSIISLTELLE